MNLFDKICAVIAIPAGFLFMGGSILGQLDWSAPFKLQVSGPFLILTFLSGWGMSITLIRFWLHSNRAKEESVDKDAMVSPFAGDPRYHEFLNQHPEFLHAPRAIRHHGFSSWLTRRLPKAEPV